MKKVILLLSVSLIGLIGCDKGGGGGNNTNDDRYYNGYGYGNGYGNNRACRANNTIRYREIGGRCEDTRTGRPVSFQKCENQNYSYQQRCGGAGYGGYNYGQWGTPNATACSVYDRPGETFVPVYYPNTGTTVCVGFATFNQIGYGYNPVMWNGMNGVYQGCSPGSMGCASFGGTLGIYVGAGVGFGAGAGYGYGNGGYRW